MKTLRIGIASICLVLIALLGACKEGGTVKTAQLGEAVTLKINETAKLPADELSVTFKGVTNDSRCPQGTQCVVAGEATVVLGIKAGEKSQDVEVKVGAAAENKTTFEPFVIRLLALDPYPTAGQTIQDSARELQLRIDRTGA